MKVKLHQQVAGGVPQSVVDVPDDQTRDGMPYAEWLVQRGYASRVAEPKQQQRVMAEPEPAPATKGKRRSSS